MSTPNPTHIDVIAKHADFVGGDSIRHCSCGRWHSTDGQGQHSRLAHAEHVVSKLGDAGYSIVPTRVLELPSKWTKSAESIESATGADEETWAMRGCISQLEAALAAAAEGEKL